MHELLHLVVCPVRGDAYPRRGIDSFYSPDPEARPPMNDRQGDSSYTLSPWVVDSRPGPLPPTDVVRAVITTYPMGPNDPEMYPATWDELHRVLAHCLIRDAVVKHHAGEARRRLEEQDANRKACAEEMARQLQERRAEFFADMPHSFSSHTKKALTTNGILTGTHIIQLTAHGFRQLPGVGDGVFNQVRNLLRGYGLDFAPEPDYRNT